MMMMSRASCSMQEGLSVFQWGDAACVQQLRYGAPGFPGTGEKLLAIPGPPGTGLVLAGHKKVRHRKRHTKM